MPARRKNPLFEFSEHWIAREPGQPNLYHFWNDPKRSRTRRRSLRTIDLTIAIERFKESLAQIKPTRAQQLHRELRPLGRVYFLRAGEHGLIKIGWTKRHPTARAAQLQTGSAAPIVLLASMAASYEDEQRLQKQFGKDWQRGEWFTPTPELLRLIALIRANAVPFPQQGRTMDELMPEEKILELRPELSASRLLAARNAGRLTWSKGKHHRPWYRLVDVDAYIASYPRAPDRHGL